MVARLSLACSAIFLGHTIGALLFASISAMLCGVSLQGTFEASMRRSRTPSRDRIKASGAGIGPGTEPEASTLAGEQRSTTLQRLEAQFREHERRHLEWLAYLAHDLGTPVERIIARLRAMESIATDEPQRMKQLLSEAERGLRQLSELICSISQLADLESNLERNFTTIPLDDVLVQLIDSFEFEACSRDIELDLRIVPGIGSVRVEKYLIRRSIENLMTNALRHTPDGGLISVRAERMGNFVQILVSDTGPGIPDEIRQDIFNFGFRGPGERPARAGAHGLGLAFVKRVAEIHQGTVGVRNREDSGAEFKLMLPLPPAAGDYALSL